MIGYEDYINAEEKHYLNTLKGFDKLVDMIKSESIFSPNEEITEVPNENLKMLMLPFYEA